jgi:hypothetical protein
MVTVNVLIMGDRGFGIIDSLLEIESCGVFFVLFFVVLGFELRAYILSHSTSPFFVKGFL